MTKDKSGLLPCNCGKIGSNRLVTNYFGSWSMLSEKEFSSLNRCSTGQGGRLSGRLKKDGIIIDRQNFSRVLDGYKTLNRFLFQGPSLHIVVPTLRCNHKCVYCHAAPPDARDSDMDRATAINVLNFIFKTQSKAVTIEFQGGEPLLNWDIVKLIVKEAGRLNEKYEKKNLRIAIVSNLTLMDEKKLDFLVRNNVSVCTSLDGPEKVHNANRNYINGKGTYKDVVKWIGKIKEGYRKRKSAAELNALVTVTRHSLPYWKEIIDEYAGQGFSTVHLRFLNRLGRARENWGEISCTPEEFTAFWKKGMDYMIALNKKGIRIKERTASLMLEKILNKRCPGYAELMSPCGAGRTQLAYSFNGDVYTCDEARMLNEELFRLGNVHKNTYKEVMRSGSLIGTCYASVLDNYCPDCVFRPFCGTCPVLNYAEQGTLVPKIRETAKCKIYKEQFSHIFGSISKNLSEYDILRKWVDE
jgi:His-Xaa-Ser system radical SAM maturase HxsB